MTERRGRASSPALREKTAEKKDDDEKSNMPSEKAAEKQEDSTKERRRSRSLSLERAKGLAHKVAKETNRAPLIHFPQGKFAPPPQLDKDAARDQHDVANLLALPIIVASALSYLSTRSDYAYKQLFAVVLFYFVADFAWVIVVPSCVKSTFTIKMHHTAALLYLIVPYKYPEYGHFLGYCMLLELNTWFLIARRFWNRNYKWHSIGFYITWVTIRLGLFTYLFHAACKAYYEKVFIQLDKDSNGKLSIPEMLRLGNWVHIMMLAPVLQALFCALNYKWTYDLVCQKWYDKGPSKGL